MCEFMLRLGHNLAIVAYLARWRAEADWKIAFLISEEYLVIISVYILYRNLVIFGSMTPEFKSKKLYSRRGKFF